MRYPEGAREYAAVTRCHICRSSDPKFLPFSLQCVWICILGDSLPMLRRHGVASQEDASRPDAHPKSKGNILKINYLQVQCNWCWETWIR